MAVSWAEDPWLASILGRPVYRWHAPSSLPLESRVREELVGLLSDGSHPIFAYAKTRTDQLDEAHLLESLGFRLVDTNVQFTKPVSIANSAPTGVRLASSVDESVTVEVARRSFVFSRFHLDPRFERETADRVKAEWVRGYFKGKRGQKMVLAIEGDTVAGFLQLLDSGGGSWTIDLIAVDPAFQRKGVARRMIGFAEQSLPGVRELRVGTQVANSPSLALYENMGFRAATASYVFHFHSAG